MMFKETWFLNKERREGSGCALPVSALTLAPPAARQLPSGSVVSGSRPPAHILCVDASYRLSWAACSEPTALWCTLWRFSAAGIFLSSGFAPSSLISACSGWVRSSTEADGASPIFDSRSAGTSAISAIVAAPGLLACRGRFGSCLVGFRRLRSGFPSERRHLLPASRGRVPLFRMVFSLLVNSKKTVVQRWWWRVLRLHSKRHANSSMRF